jgi:anti-sigma B factor antagonist
METLDLKVKDNYNFIKYSGELTLDVVEELKKEIIDFLDEQKDNIVIFDLSEISFMDSSGIGFLVHLNNQNRSKNRKLYLYKPSDAVKKTLSLVNLINFFEIIENEEDIDLEKML